MDQVNTIIQSDNIATKFEFCWNIDVFNIPPS